MAVRAERMYKIIADRSQRSPEPRITTGTKVQHAFPTRDDANGNDAGAMGDLLKRTSTWFHTEKKLGFPPRGSSKES